MGGSVGPETGGGKAPQSTGRPAGGGKAWKLAFEVIIVAGSNAAFDLVALSPSQSRTDNNLYVAEKAMNVGEIVCSLSDFDDGHNVGQSFAWSHV